MHIIFVTTELAAINSSAGGLATFTANMARIFSRHGNKAEIILVTTKEQHIIFDKEIRLKNIYIEKADWDVYNDVAKLYYDENEERIDAKRRELMGFRKIELVRDEIERIHKADKVDIVHFCNHGAFSIMLNTNIPYVVRISGYLNICFGLANTPSGSIDFADNPLEMRDKLEIYAMKKANQVIAPSRLLADIAREHMGINPTVLESPFVLLENNWDYSVINKELCGKSYLLFFGALRYLKGIHVVAEMAETFLCQNPQRYLVLSGKNKELTLENGTVVMASEYVREKAGQFSNRVIYLGQLVREQLYPVIKNAELCILPSRIENLSNACIEAMALGKIVVATNGASFEQLIEDRVSGYLCERDNVDDFLSAVKEALMLQKDAKDAMIKKAQQRVEELKPDRIYEKYFKIYNQVIQEKTMLEKQELDDD